MGFGVARQNPYNIIIFMNPIILLTGATGFLGTQIARQLLTNGDIRLLALVRAPDSQSALLRLRRAWWDWPELRDALTERVSVLCGDVSLPNLGLDAATYSRLSREVSHFVHAAADIRLFAPLEELRQVNTVGTRHALALAQAAHADHGLLRFAHISTAYVAGKQRGEISESWLSDRAGFNSPYERSKYEAELLVRAASDSLPVSVFRPSMIVGDSHTGEVQAFNTLYYPLRLYLTGQMSVAPANPRLRVNLVPVDHVASAVARLLFDPRAAGLTFHLNPSQQDLPTLADIADFTRAWAQSEMGLRLPPALYLPGLPLGKSATRLAKRFAPSLTPIAELLPYFQNQPKLSNANVDRLLGPSNYNWRACLPPMLAFAVKHSFWRRTSRTVFEQIIARLNSRSKIIRYHDLAGGQETLRSAAEVRTEILATTKAIRALGIQPGERIGLAGLNSTRYFAALVASGLAGTVSAPLYATCPPAEITSLLRDAQARLFLVGSPELLARLDEVEFDGPVVSFCKGAPPTSTRRRIIPWEEFIASAAGAPKANQPLPLDAPAALCFTSGTTGEPKGVLFRHDQLRWLAETLASMYPWHERNTWGAYLSYLPMNHVVEGILANYSPYYVPAALDIYFLEEFAALPQALKIARPTIFFSVPRFFEKVRAALNENPLAQFYQRQTQPILRAGLRVLLRRGLLRKTGLDRCRQMIVGSAPTSAELLGFFRDLGVEVHDAYGLSEAPLVTLNRLGHNQPGTLGPPLPETSLRLATDGELQIRGPQVAAGYFNHGLLTPFEGGWLNSGDLASLGPGQVLSLNGRKKDFIITSYAKKISPPPIEAALRAVAGVAEAMLVGEARPYCTALLWMEPGTWSPEAGRAVAEAIRALNARLPDPEQVKRWAVLPGELTPQDGSLTGSMKLRRSVILARNSTVVEALYRGAPPPGVLQIGNYAA
jgi:long-chain acyl-CoA synthetase